MRAFSCFRFMNRWLWFDSCAAKLKLKREGMMLGYCANFLLNGQLIMAMLNCYEGCIMTTYLLFIPLRSDKVNFFFQVSSYSNAKYETILGGEKKKEDLLGLGLL